LWCVISRVIASVIATTTPSTSHMHARARTHPHAQMHARSHAHTLARTHLFQNRRVWYTEQAAHVIAVCEHLEICDAILLSSSSTRYGSFLIRTVGHYCFGKYVCCHLYVVLHNVKTRLCAMRYAPCAMRHAPCAMHAMRAMRTCLLDRSC
jgi:hypothetical protein